MTRIVQSAVIHKWKIYTGKRHSDCIAKAHKETWDKPISWEQWFVTENWDFYNRDEAWTIAALAWQIPAPKKLYSEDLW